MWSVDATLHTLLPLHLPRQTTERLHHVPVMTQLGMHGHLLSSWSVTKVEDDRHCAP